MTNKEKKEAKRYIVHMRERQRGGLDALARANGPLHTRGPDKEKKV